jgi:hypothetical protein
MRHPKAKITRVLPTVMFMPTLPVPAAIAHDLTEMVDRALERMKGVDAEFDPAGKAIFASIFAPDRAQRAAQFYVTTKQHQVALPDFRKVVDRKKKGSIAAAAANLLDLLQSDNQPPFAQMRALYCSMDPSVDGLDEPSDAEELPEPLSDGEKEAPYDHDSSDPEGIWRAKYTPDVMRDILTQWLGLMDELYKQAGGGKAGRSSSEAEINFVSWLAAYWHGELGLPLSSGRGAPPDRNLHDQQGSFAQFVRRAADLVPAKYRPYSWDHAIRENLP